MKGDAGVIDYLNKALRSYGRLADKSRKESIEEMHHADKLIDRIIFLEGHPNLQTLDPLRIGESPRETLDCDLAAENEARALYAEAREYCRKVADYVTMDLFEELMTDEEGHIDFLETQIDLVGRIGEQNWGQLNAKPADEVE